MTPEECRSFTYTTTRPCLGPHGDFAVTVTATIDPCSWMYAGYGLQLSVRLPEMVKAISSASVHSDRLVEICTADDARSMVDAVNLIPCKHCGEPAFDPTTVRTNRDGACESCFLAELNAEWEKADAKEKQREARADAKYKKKGFTHKTIAWVHPPHGDDFALVMYHPAQPTEQEITAALRRRKSRILDDYKTTEL